MNNSSEIFPTNGTDVSDGFLVFFGLNFIVILLGFPLNSYVIWLILRGAGNGLAAEFFSLNLSVCEIVCLQWVFLSFFNNSEIILIIVVVLDAFSFTGRAQFLCLMCVERYLAVVYPVTFLKCKPLRYRVICCVIVWVVSAIFGGFKVVNWYSACKDISYLTLAQFLLFPSIQLFCLVSVLTALKQSGPGERKKLKEKNHMKRRAFYIILITTMTMLTSVVFYMIPFVAVVFEIMHGISFIYIFYVSYKCIIMAGWVQPLFFFYRVGKLPFIRA